MHFTELNFKNWVIDELNELKITRLTEIQEKTIPSVLKNN